VRLVFRCQKVKSNETSRLIQSLTYLEKKDLCPCFVTYGRFEMARSGLANSAMEQEAKLQSH
jgi:hypothetical protein